MSSSTRGRAGKFQKAKRGGTSKLRSIEWITVLTGFSGGRNFSKNLRPLDADGGERGMWAEPQSDDSSDDSSDDDSDEDSSDDGAPGQQQEQEMTREQRKAAQKAKKDAAIKKKQGSAQPGDMPPSDSESEEEQRGDMPANPNHSMAAKKMVAKATADPSAPRKVKKDTDVSQLSRREREALQAQQAKERYQKLHAEGKTDEARADMERLKLVRQQREEAAATKEAEKQEKELVNKEKKEQMARMERQQAMKAARGNRGAKKGGKS